MRIAGSSLLFSRLSLEKALERLSELGFEAVDIGLQEEWAHVNPSSIVDDQRASTRRIEQACETAGLEPVSLNVSVGDVSTEQEVRQIEAIVDIAVALGIDVVTLPAANTETPLKDDFKRFGTLVEAIQGRDIKLTVETHWGTHTEHPDVAAEYSAAIPGLGYTLDPGHYAIRSDWSHDMYAPLLSDVNHVHLRQAGNGWGQIQQPFEDGRIDFEYVIKQLNSVKYRDTLTVEYIDSLEGVDPNVAMRQATETQERLQELL